MLHRAGVTLSYLITYTALSQALAPLLNARLSLNEQFASGAISVRLTWPTDMAGLYAAEWMGGIFWSTVLGAIVF